MTWPSQVEFHPGIGIRLSNCLTNTNQRRFFFAIWKTPSLEDLTPQQFKRLADRPRLELVRLSAKKNVFFFFASPLCMATVIWGMARSTRQMFFFPPDASLDWLRGLLWSNRGNKESGQARCQLLSCFFQRTIPMMIVVLGISGETCLSSSSDWVAEKQASWRVFSLQLVVGANPP